VKKLFIGIAVFITWGWKALTTGVKVATNLVFLLSLLFLITLLFFRPEATVPDNAALLLNPEGAIVEQRSAIDPMARAINKIAGISTHEETPLQDILDAINTAAMDERIKMLVISPSKLERAGFNQLRDIGNAIEHFKNKGKVVIAADNSFNQSQYYLAAYADEIYLNPMGRVELRGFGVYRLYFKDLLHKLNVKFHVFKVGTYKSALEPFLRDNMSPQAKEANQQWLTRLWSTYSQDIGKQRGLTAQVINDFINNLDVFLKKADGDPAVMALNGGLIDGLKTRRQLEDYLSSVVGREDNGSGYKHISFYNYLDTITTSYSTPQTDSPNVGIIVAQGNIVNGQGTVRQIGAESLIKRIQQARMDKNINAVVLRIDSGGGSAFASELIRQELLRTREAGKPVVISMGSLAASGAYWLAADADAILASPVTLTGSIGIFGALPTFEESLAWAGVYNDGIGTTTMAGALSPTRDLPPALSRALQLGVEHGYRQFINIVAEGRHLSLPQVEKIAEGRVWDGKTAMEIGLVDGIGSLEDAIDRAAELAGLSSASGVYIEPPSTFMSNLQLFGKQAFSVFSKKDTITSTMVALTRQTLQHFDFLIQGADPTNIYAHCLLSSSTFDF